MRFRSVLLAGVVLSALTACQPSDDAVGGEDASPPEAVTVAPLGAPAAGMPGTLAELREQTWPLATQWQAEPVLADVAVELDEEFGWQEAQMTYLAADSDRILSVTVMPEQTSQGRPTLATLGLAPVTPQGINEIPAFPDGAAEPAAAAEAGRPLLAECGVVEAPSRVLYATGAPGAWDGTQWTEPLRWTAAVTTAGGGAAFLDAVTLEALPDRPCVS